MGDPSLRFMLSGFAGCFGGNVHLAKVGHTALSESFHVVWSWVPHFLTLSCLTKHFHLVTLMWLSLLMIANNQGRKFILCL